LAREHLKIRDPLLIFATVEAINFKFVIQRGFECSYQKEPVGPKLAGSWLEEHPKN